MSDAPSDPAEAVRQFGDWVIHLHDNQIAVFTLIKEAMPAWAQWGNTKETTIVLPHATINLRAPNVIYTFDIKEDVVLAYRPDIGSALQIPTYDPDFPEKLWAMIAQLEIDYDAQVSAKIVEETVYGPRFRLLHYRHALPGYYSF